MFWKTRTHKLPKFPHEIIPTFRQLCEVIPSDRIPPLREAVKANLEQIKEQAQKNPSMDVEGAEALADMCNFLLDIYEDHPLAKKKLIIGAVRYFAVADDPFDDVMFASGFFDDMMVMNYVLEDLGIEEKYFSVK